MSKEFTLKLCKPRVVKSSDKEVKSSWGAELIRIIEMDGETYATILTADDADGESVAEALECVATVGALPDKLVETFLVDYDAPRIARDTIVEIGDPEILAGDAANDRRRLRICLEALQRIADSGESESADMAGVALEKCPPRDAEARDWESAVRVSNVPEDADWPLYVSVFGRWPKGHPHGDRATKIAEELAQRYDSSRA